MDKFKKVKTAKRTRVKFARLQVTNTYVGYQCPHCGVLYCNGGPKLNVTRFRCERCDNEIIVDGQDELSYDDLMDGNFHKVIPQQAQMWKVVKGE
ncbi:MAG: hypothetical protein WC495_05875 [Patescibacteria group bacterium]|jgi:predicted RNA-binding Zn-ribbon protein involved in translation (DUF1610 family)